MQSFEHSNRIDSHLQRRTHQSNASALVLDVPFELQERLPSIRAQLALVEGDLASNSVQTQVRDLLMQVREWREWISAVRPGATTCPTLVRSGLELERDDEVAHKVLVGLARSMHPDSLVPPYSMGGSAVTEVIAERGASRESHSINDLPAPPHTAGFFEPVPPQYCYFSCIRPHPGGGAETTVLNLEAVLDKAPQILIDEWSSKPYELITSKRLGSETKPFALLSWVDGLPFLRYRKEYMVGFDCDPSLIFLKELVENPAHHYTFALQRGETIFHWNGAPHSRYPQIGETPSSIDLRRKLIRCRTQPQEGWNEQFCTDSPC